MTTCISIHGNEILELVSTYPDGIRLSQLAEIVTARFGPSATFHTCSILSLDLDDLLVFLEARNKVRIVSGVVFPGGIPACHH